ncbi:TPA: hypothetical protein PJG37_001650 [Escherichia coli]|nr:hypothetical protein [Escherichia coli]HDH7313610.1 hypothetical protein [Escherichia coli]HEI3801364.1 hypothetical protein [Escherichia coli]
MAAFQPEQRKFYNGAWVGHKKSSKVAKYCKQRMLVAVSSHQKWRSWTIFVDF